MPRLRFTQILVHSFVPICWGKARIKEPSKKYRCIEPTDCVLREQSLLPLFVKVLFLVGDLSFRVPARCPFLSPSLSILALKPDEVLDIGWVEHPTWIFREIKFGMARPAKRYSVVCAGKAEVYEAPFKQNFRLQK